MRKHITKICMMPGCYNEADRWFEEPDELRGTFHTCQEHPEVEEAEERGDATITNSKGCRVELAVYSCHEDCDICNQ